MAPSVFYFLTNHINDYSKNNTRNFLHSFFNCESLMKKRIDLPSNEDELLQYYGLSGTMGRLKIKFIFAKTWILHQIAYSCPLSGIVVKAQRMRGVKIGNSCYFSPYVLLDIIYPDKIWIEDNVTIGSNSMIFAHVNPTANSDLRKIFPRRIENVHIKKGAVIFPGCIITAGVTIGENSMIGAGSVVSEDIPDNCIALGNPARVIKKINLDE